MILRSYLGSRRGEISTLHPGLFTAGKNSGTHWIAGWMRGPQSWSGRLWRIIIIRQMKHQLDATLCRFYFCRVTLHVSGASAHHQEYLKLVQRQLLHVLSLQVSHHISLLGPEVKWNTNLMQYCAGFISAESLYMFRAQAPIIRSI